MIIFGFMHLTLILGRRKKYIHTLYKFSISQKTLRYLQYSNNVKDSY